MELLIKNTHHPTLHHELGVIREKHLELLELASKTADIIYLLRSGGLVE
jgi:hypothetical protein